jgi:hypothetical protein
MDRQGRGASAPHPAAATGAALEHALGVIAKGREILPVMKPVKEGAVFSK